MQNSHHLAYGPGKLSRKVLYKHSEWRRLSFLAVGRCLQCTQSGVMAPTSSIADRLHLMPPHSPTATFAAPASPLPWIPQSVPRVRHYPAAAPGDQAVPICCDCTANSRYFSACAAIPSR
jgi:hypothetical protein